MDFEIKTLSLAQAATLPADALLVLVPQGFTPGVDGLSELLAQALKAHDFEARASSLLHLYRAPGVAAKHLVFVGVAEATPAQVRAAVAAALRSLKAARPKQLLLSLAALPQSQTEGIVAALQGLAEASYVYTTTKPKAEARSLQLVRLGVSDAPACQAAFERGVALVAGIELAKEWGNRPGNHATPTLLAKAAKALADAHGLHCEVMDKGDVTKLGMGAFLAVAQGSQEPLRFITLRYQGAPKTQAPVVLVGKGITFDSGGISIKPAPEMDEMKFDMCGAASVLGVFRSVAALKPRINLIGLIPSCENLPDGHAIKPGDVVTTMSGQTVEILNTDAEGRLILCDALTYAKRFKPSAVVDIATLTGACVIALGAVRSGLFANDDALAQELYQAGEQALDRCWRMPLDDDYAEGLKTHFADVANVAGRPGGSVTAAKFLQRFVDDLKWAHLDIAGTAWKSGADKGATGRPVALLLNYLLAQQAPAPAPRARKSAKK